MPYIPIDCLTKLCAYIDKTHSKSTYHKSSLNMDSVMFKYSDFIIANMLKYLSRYIAESGDKAGNVDDLYKSLHYGYYYLIYDISESVDEFSNLKSLSSYDICNYHTFVLGGFPSTIYNFVCNYNTDFAFKHDFIDSTPLELFMVGMYYLNKNSINESRGL